MAEYLRYYQRRDTMIKHETCRSMPQIMKSYSWQIRRFQYCDKIPEAQAYLHKQLERLKQGKVPLQELVVSQTLSRDPTVYRVKSPTARAALQFIQMGRDVRLGMRMRFIYVRGDKRVKAWGMPGDTYVDVEQYILLLKRAANEVLDIAHRENRLEPLPMDQALRSLCEPLPI